MDDVHTIYIYTLLASLDDLRLPQSQVVGKKFASDKFLMTFFYTDFPHRQYLTFNTNVTSCVKQVLFHVLVKNIVGWRDGSKHIHV